jgi:predicted dehydrogenase
VYRQAFERQRDVFAGGAMSDHEKNETKIASTDSENGVPRRSFLKHAAIAAAAVTIVPRHVLGAGFTAPSDKLNIAGVGVGGMGRGNLLNLSSQNIVALCDVDWGFVDKGFEQFTKGVSTVSERLAKAQTDQQRQNIQRQADNGKALVDQLPKAKRYQDYREMLQQQKDIDGVMIATPDHMHAPIALAAMDLGKHVYVQKPLTWSVDEARKLAKKAKENPKIATQMGNQGHSRDDARKVIEYIQAGAIGEVKEVHVWTNRPLGYWPQGVPRPAPSSTPSEKLGWDGRAVTERLAAALTGNYPVPNGLAWDLFLGVAPQVEYHPIYHPFNWRGWVDWGQGALGDMGAHLIDHPFWALELGLPTSIETISTPFNKVSFPSATTTYYEFAARGSRPPVKLTWYDGGMLPPKPEELGEEQVNPGGGVMFIGSKGKLMHDTYGANPRLLPKALHDSYGDPPKKLPRIATSHEMNWVEAAMGKTEASSPFSYAAPLTETMLLGIVSLRAGTKLHYDGANMRVTNSAAANDFLRREPRAGWS